MFIKSEMNHIFTSMKMLKKILPALIFISAFAFQGLAQSDDNAWTTLAKLTYKMEYDEMMGFDVEVPVFSQDIIDLSGKEISIQGYIVPVDGYKQQDHFVFSAYPYNMCFFCGQAGKETVMEVFSDDPKITFTSKPIKIKGVLELNSSDVNQLMYILKDAVLVSKDLE